MKFSTPLRSLKFPALTESSKRPMIEGSGLSRLESYVQFPVPQITTFMLLVHLAFGCCVHHAHACDTNCCSEPSTTAEECPCGAHRHYNLTEHSVNEAGCLAEPGADGGRHHCEGIPCTFVHSRPSAKQVGERVADGLLLEIVAADSHADSFRSRLDRGLDQRFSVAGSSLRTHLVLRVLLI